MSEAKAYKRGVMVGLLAMVGAQAVHWFITASPDTSDPSTLRTVAVAIQAVVGLGGALWLSLEHRRSRQAHHA